MGILIPTLDLSGMNAVPFNNPLISSDAFNAAIIWFEGDPESLPNTTVTSTTIVNFFLDATADTSVNTTGSIDFSNAASDTLGEIADLINASTTGWKMQISAGFRNQVVYSAGSLDVILSGLNGATFATGYATGFPWDVSKILEVRVCIGPEANADVLGGGRRSEQVLRSTEYNPAEENFFKQYQSYQWQNLLSECTGLLTSGTGILTVFSADQTSTTTTATALPISGATWADGVVTTIGAGEIIAVSKPGQRLVLRFVTADTPTAIAFSGTGYASPDPVMGLFSAA